MDTHVSGHILSHPFEAMAAMAGLIWYGIFEKFPKLRVVHVEADGGWVPYWLQRMEQHWDFSGNSEHEYLTQRPTEYFKSNIFVAFRGDEPTMKAARGSGRRQQLPVGHRLSTSRRHLPVGNRRRTETINPALEQEKNPVGQRRQSIQFQLSEVLSVELELLFEITAAIAPPILIPDTPDGTRVVVHVTGGKFEGPRLKGTVLASGADWFLVRADGKSESSTCASY